MSGRILILGAAGRLGRAAAQAFQEAGWTVVGLVRPGAGWRALPNTIVVEDDGLHREAVLEAYEPVGLGETVSYSLGDVGFNLYWAPLTAFLMIYLTDVAGITVAAAATLLGVMRLLGAVADPVFAAIADRTRTQYGHYRPYFLWLCVPLAAAETGRAHRRRALIAVRPFSR